MPLTSYTTNKRCGRFSRWTRTATTAVSTRLCHEIYLSPDDLFIQIYLLLPSSHPPTDAIWKRNFITANLFRSSKKKNVFMEFRNDLYISKRKADPRNVTNNSFPDKILDHKRNTRFKFFST